VTSRCFPEDPDFEHETERLVWTALRDQLPDDAALFANLPFTDRKGDCEADLVVALPGAGIAVIEVKGGHVYRAGDTWRQTGGGAHGKAIRPMEQAKRAKFALRDHVNDDARWRRRRVRFAHLVAFPTSRIADNVNATDSPRWLVVDQTQTGQIASVVKDILIRQDHENPLASKKDVDDLIDIVAGRPMSQRDLVSEANARSAECDLLTSGQAHVLDYIKLLNRVEVRGGAGSGKTWLAVEQARRLARQGQRVGLLCYSRGLSAYLKRRVELLPPDQRPAYVDTFHELGVAWGAPRGLDDDSEYWETHLPMQMRQMAPHLVDAERFDAFVVDEAQDFSDAWWPALVAGLRDPDRGGLFAFADESQRVFARQGHPPVQLVPISLDDNLRNTKQIAQTFGSLAPWQMRYRGGDGVPVRFVQCSSDEAMTEADDVVDGLLADGWAHEHIALLTTGHRHPVQVERQLHGHDAYWQSYWEGDDAFYGHVLGFKGLERPAVVLAVNGFRDVERAKEMLYVGLSRARDLLVVCGDLEEIRAVGGDGVANRLSDGHG
jgi:Nuclease-related domain/UvrD-like helicase C-terminal domain/AAA domain